MKSANIGFRLLFSHLIATGLLLLAQPFARGAELASQRVLLDGEWRFSTDPNDVGVSQKWFDAVAPNDWRTVHVPRNWDDYGLSGYDGVGWFLREFELPADEPLKNWGVMLLAVDDRAQVWVNGIKVAEQPNNGQRFAFSLNGAGRPGRNLIAVRVQDVGGPGGIIRSVYLGKYAESPEELFEGPLRRLPARASADWVRDAVIYEVYLRSFSSEGTFRGLEERLPELKRLGVTVLWLMPIHPVGVRNRKGSLGSPYSVRDYMAVNPEFGTLEDFESLVRAAHANELKLIIDWVANHTAWDGPVFDEHPDWYTRDKSGQIIPPVPDWSDTADLDYDAPGVREYMQRAMNFWIHDKGIDGFRCDVAGMVPLDFWESVVPGLERERQIMMLAEDDDPAEHVKAFDLTYDWRLWSLLGRLPKEELTPGDLRSLLRDEDNEFPRGSLRLRFSDNHDKCAWEEPALPRYGRSTKAAALITFLLPGVPLIYNGQEVGNTQKLSLFEKMPIYWSADAMNLRQFYSDLCRMRRENAAMTRGTCRLPDTHDALGVLTVIREHSGNRIAAFINLRAQAIRCTRSADTRSMRALLAEGAQLHGEEISLEPFGFWIGAG